MATKAEVQAGLLKAAQALYNQRHLYNYTQYRPMPGCLLCSDAFRKLDCSSTVTELYREAGAPDPNGRGYDGYGYTGTLIGQGNRVTGTPQVGDLTFYGDPYGASGHVVMHLGSTQCISFGSNPISLRHWKYRSDYDQTRRYELGTPEVVEYWLEELPWTAGGRGPKVNGPWIDTSDRPIAQKWKGAQALYRRMRDQGKKVVARTIGNRYYILEYLPNTLEVQLRYGYWAVPEDRKVARASIEKRLGRKLRPYSHRANTHYPMLTHKLGAN